MVLSTAVAVAGSPLNGAELAQLNKSAVAIEKGKVLYYDPADDNFKLAPAGGVSTRYAVCVKSALAADTKVLAAVKGPVLVVADGTIGAGAPCKVSGTTAGEVVEGANTAVADQNALIGYNAGKSSNNERDGLSQAGVVDGDIFILNLSGGLSA